MAPQTGLETPLGQTRAGPVLLVDGTCSWVTKSRPGWEGWTLSCLSPALCPACTPQTPPPALCSSSPLLEGEEWSQSRGYVTLPALVLIAARRPRKKHLPSFGEGCYGEKDDNLHRCLGAKTPWSCLAVVNRWASNHSTTDGIFRYHTKLLPWWKHFPIIVATGLL